MKQWPPYGSVDSLVVEIPTSSTRPGWSVRGCLVLHRSTVRISEVCPVLLASVRIKLPTELLRVH